MVECESFIQSYRLTENLVLIDTWWNVNEEFTNYLKEAGFVLIDTWWNVNQNVVATQKRKYKVLIDTWWNVNFSESINCHISLSF